VFCVELINQDINYSLRLSFEQVYEEHVYIEKLGINQAKQAAILLPFLHLRCLVF
jgi:hypothetical protein